MKTISKISIITINFNNADGLQKTIESVIAQSYKNIEYIIVDGNSTDASVEVITSYADYIHYWVSEPDRGIYHAMNKGIAKATGDYLLFLNSGDYFYSQEALLHFYKSYIAFPNRDLYFGNINVVAEKEWIKDYPKTLTFSYFLAGTIPHPATIIKRKCFEVLQYDESLKIVSDWKFFVLGICKLNFSYLYIDDVITTFMYDGISSINEKLVAEERKQVLKEEFYMFLDDYNELNKLKKDIKYKKEAGIFYRVFRKIYHSIRNI